MQLRLLAAGLLLTIGAMCQTPVVTFTVTPPTVPAAPGTSVVVPVTINSTTGPAAVQFFLNYNSAVFGPPTFTIDPSIAATKSATCALVTGIYGCIVANTLPANTAIPNGPLGSYSLPLLATAPGASATISLVNTLGADPTSAPLVANLPTATVLITDPCDLNNDGVVNISDIIVAIQQLLAVVPCTTADLNKDGKCTVVDLERIAVAWGGGACKVGP